MEREYPTLKDGLLIVVRGFVDRTFKPMSNIVGVSDPQTLTNKTINGDLNQIVNFPSGFVEVSEDYVVLTTDDTIKCINGCTQVTLLSATLVFKKIFQIKNRSDLPVDLVASSGELIDDDTDLMIPVNTNFTVQSDGTNWMLM